MTNITIPPEALEAAAKAMWKTDDPSQWELGMARAACIAMLKAWPGMERFSGYEYGVPDVFHLPLPKESTNAKA